MKRFCFLLFCVSIVSYGQTYELGKVTLDELSEKVCKIDTSAPAAILFAIGKVGFNYSENSGFVMKTTVKTKIKVYKKEGYEWANKAVSYYIGGNSKEKVVFSNAVTYNLENGKIVKSKLKSDGEFDVNINKYWAQKKIALPNVKEGSIIEYEFDVITENLGSIDEWEFQATIPVMYSKFSTFIPEYFIYKPEIRGYLQPQITSQKNSRSFSITTKERSGSQVSKTTFSTDKIDYTETQTDFVIQNIPALQEEAFVSNYRNYLSSVGLELSATHYPNQPYKTFSMDWESVVKSIYDMEDFGLELNKNGYFESDIEELTKGISEPKERINLVFNFVKNRMTWNEFYGYSCDLGVKKAYADKVGNVAEINLMLTSMLRNVGIEANPVILNTRQNRTPLFPSRKAFNYVICGVELNNQIILLDATSKYAMPNILPIRDLNWFGRLIRKDGTSISISLNPTFVSKETVNLMGTIFADGHVEGKVRKQYHDYTALGYRTRYGNVSKESIQENLEKNNNGIEIGDFDVANKLDLGKPIVESYSFTNENTTETIGDKIYFSPLFHLVQTVNPFKQEKREYPIDFVYPFQDKFNISITIPEGYTVESLPENKAFSLAENKGSIRYTISESNKTIQLLFIFEISESLFSADDYENLKLFFKEAISKQNEKIVLKKV